MRVVELSAAIVRIPLKKPIRHASHVRTTTDNIVVKCVLADGTVGYGEGVPREYVTGETAETALELLTKSNVAAQLEVCRDFAQAVNVCERLKLNPVPNDDRGIVGNAGRCALELALLDAYGRVYGEPLMNITRMLEPELYEPQDTVRYSGIVTSAKGLKARALGWGYRLFGFKQVKVKVGIEGQNDYQRLKILRASLGRKMGIRLDANEAWANGEAKAKIEELLPFNIESVEQPVPHEQVAELKEVRKVGVPIMLDESLCGMVDAVRSVDGGWADAFNIRLSKCGGFIPSLRLASYAKAQGITCQLGCQVGETAILSAAGRHFATSVKGLTAREGSYDKHLVMDALGEEDISFGRGGLAPMLTGCGTGIKLDAARLTNVTVNTVSLVG